MPNVTIARGPWVIDTTSITSTTRTGANSFNVIAAGVGYTLTLAETIQLGVQNLAAQFPVVAGNNNGSPAINGQNSRFEGLITQAGTAAPTIPTTFVDQIGFAGATPARTSAGLYTFTLTGAFPASKCFADLQIVGGATGFTATFERTSADVLTMRVFDAAAAAADLVGSVIVDLKIWP